MPPASSRKVGRRIDALKLAAGVLACAGLIGAAHAAPRFDTQQAGAAVALLADAASHGLNPADYGMPVLARAVETAADTPAPEAAQRLDAALTAAMRRYLQDLHDGRVTPAQLDQRFPPARREPFDAVQVLAAALAANDLAQAVRLAVPALPQYERLRTALAQYRLLQAHPAWREPLPPLPPGQVLKPGKPWPGLADLAARLVALGDMAPAINASTTVYDEALVAAVQAFQTRHALKPDSVIGRSTWSALQATPTQRVRQLELTLERLRWTPLLQGPRMIVVNIPEFVLRAYEVQDDRVVVRVESKIIVGNAMDTRTPLIDEDLRRIEFNPYWNVPRSIARAELVPRLRRDPAHWLREGFEFVDGRGRADAVLSPVKLQAVLEGSLRIRQRPGPRNALGDIKFVFPNRESIYLHHTPDVRLFDRDRRDISHGCIRVEQPIALAAFALSGQPEGAEPAIRQAIAEGRRSTVALAEPIPVLIAYGTALVKQSRVYFFNDLYQHDAALDAALRRLARPAIAW
jgi:L,D-transpeptidase YcbB